MARPSSSSTSAGDSTRSRKRPARSAPVTASRFQECAGWLVASAAGSRRRWAARCRRPRTGRSRRPRGRGPSAARRRRRRRAAPRRRPTRRRARRIPPGIGRVRPRVEREGRRLERRRLRDRIERERHVSEPWNALGDVARQSLANPARPDQLGRQPDVAETWCSAVNSGWSKAIRISLPADGDLPKPDASVATDSVTTRAPTWGTGRPISVSSGGSALSTTEGSLAPGLVVRTRVPGESALPRAAPSRRTWCIRPARWPGRRASHCEGSAIGPLHEAPVGLGQRIAVDADLEATGHRDCHPPVVPNPRRREHDHRWTHAQLRIVAVGEGVRKVELHRLLEPHALPRGDGGDVALGVDRDLRQPRSPSASAAVTSVAESCIASRISGNTLNSPFQCRARCL